MESAGEKGWMVMSDGTGAALTALDCAQFTERLASPAPTPGGGGAAAMTGALAAALGAMAARLTLGKKKYLPYEEDHRRIIAETEALRARLLGLIEADAAAFEPLSRVYSMDKAAPGYAEKLRDATLEACGAPLGMMEAVWSLIALLEELLPKCSVLLRSDVGCAALTAACALESAAMNVFVNTRALPEDPELRAVARRAEELLSDGLPRARAVSGEVMAYLKGKG